MNLLTLEKVSKLYGDKNIFTDLSLGVSDTDKIGVIGINGTGKSTLLKIIAGQIEPDTGVVTRRNKVHIEYLPQHPMFEGADTVIGYVLASRPEDEQWLIEGKAKSILTKMGLGQFDMSVQKLSGGQRKKVALARILLTPADILILDEPTNHLDNEMSDWLENFLKSFNGAIIMVTHDRYFLDAVTNRIVEIDQGRLYSYEANYAKYLELRALRLDLSLASERKRQAVLKNELDWIQRGARARSTKQKARIQRFEEMSRMSGPREERAVSLEALSTRMGRTTIELRHISKAYEYPLIKDFNYIFLKNDRIGIVGPNGAGKTTLLKIIVGQEKPDEGSVIVGQTIKIGYFSQENQLMDDGTKAIDYIRSVAEYIHTGEGTKSASQMLEQFLFTPAMQWTPVGSLSGGEKRRLYLLRVLMGEPNVLILDEPTNDLDIKTLTILEDYLDHFPGIVITVSHDRYFLDRVVSRIFAFEGDGAVCQYEGGFTDYQNAKNLKETAVPKKAKEERPKTFSKKPKGEKKLKFTFKEQMEFNTIDEDIAKLEDCLEQIQRDILKYATDYTKLGECMAAKEQYEMQLEKKLERWVYLNELAERIETAKDVKS